MIIFVRNKLQKAGLEFIRNKIGQQHKEFNIIQNFNFNIFYATQKQKIRAKFKSIEGRRKYCISEQIIQQSNNILYESSLQTNYKNDNIELEENPIYYNNRSQAYFQTEELELALFDCNKALQLNPGFVKAMTNKAQVLYEMGYVQEAIECLQSINNHTPESEILLNQYQQQSLKTLLDQEELERQMRLLEWLKQGKAIFPKIKIECYSENYRGVNAKQTISAKEMILFIPKSHMITLEMAKETSVAKKMIQFRLDLLSPKHSFLSTFLLQEKLKPNSFWKPYIDILPQSYPSFPIFFNNSDLEWLKGSPFQKQIKDKLSDLKKDYTDICSIAPEFSQYLFNEFCWARMTASSRIFGINIKSVKTDAFVPLADMLNHKRPKLTSWCYSDEKQGFIIETDEKIEKGQMIFDSYGRKCNSRFLLNYGFVVEDNDANEVNVTVESDQHHPLFKLKEQTIQDSLQWPKTFRLVMDTEENTVIEFMSYIRFLVINDENQLQLLLNQKGFLNFKPTKTQPIGIYNELDMWKMIGRICKKALKQYPTTFEQDQEILKICELTTNQRNCLILRMGEKEILKFYQQFSDKMKQLLSNFNQLEINIFFSKEDNCKYLNYINKVVMFQNQNDQ
ncbi:unnamed protein product [Paramecium sonneborni]|uniref:SET domain-containing protein n=1 Tax=Paramecium sonneborni TaxID=65129 RepID=A0A8S1NDX2_9CILI|nr:unnamed protein product [Paramecium sonneborni]